MKCPDCNKELKQLEGKHKFAVQLSEDDAEQDLDVNCEGGVK